MRGDQSAGQRWKQSKRGPASSDVATILPAHTSPLQPNHGTVIDIEINTVETRTVKTGSDSELEDVAVE